MASPPSSGSSRSGKSSSPRGGSRPAPKGGAPKGAPRGSSKGGSSGGPKGGSGSKPSGSSGRSGSSSRSGSSDRSSTGRPSRSAPSSDRSRSGGAPSGRARSGGDDRATRRSTTEDGWAEGPPLETPRTWGGVARRGAGAATGRRVVGASRAWRDAVEAATPQRRPDTVRRAAPGSIPDEATDAERRAANDARAAEDDALIIDVRDETSDASTRSSSRRRDPAPIDLAGEVREQLSRAVGNARKAELSWRDRSLTGMIWPRQSRSSNKASTSLSAPCLIIYAVPMHWPISMSAVATSRRPEQCSDVSKPSIPISLIFDVELLRFGELSHLRSTV